MSTPFEQFVATLRKRSQSRLANLARPTMYNTIVRQVRAANPTSPMNRVHGIVRGKYTRVLMEGYGKITRLEQSLAKLKHQMMKEEQLQRKRQHVLGNPLNFNGNVYRNA